MGNEGSNLSIFFTYLRQDMTNARLESMNFVDVGPLFILRDLTRHILDEAILAEKISKELDNWEKEGRTWGVTEVQYYICSYRQDMKSARACMGS